MLDDADMRIEIRQPLTAFDGHAERMDGIAQEGLDLGPEEARIVVGHVGRRHVSQGRIHTGLGKLVEEGVELSGVKRITELPDQVGGADQRSLGCPLRRGRRPAARESG